MLRCKASEIPRNESYIEVRRSDQPSPEATARQARDEGNGADWRLQTASLFFIEVFIKFLQPRKVSFLILG